jgi:hypothetical protein
LVAPIGDNFFDVVVDEQAEHLFSFMFVTPERIELSFADLILPS